MKKLACVLNMVKNEDLFVDLWCRHYLRWFSPQDLYIDSDNSTDRTKEFTSPGVNFKEIQDNERPEVCHNDRYIKARITQLLEKYHVVIFAECDDFYLPSGEHHYSLGQWAEDFASSTDTYRFLTGVNIMHRIDVEPKIDMSKSLIAQRSVMVRCPQYDNPMLWKQTPLWGRGWHDIGGKRLFGMGDGSIYNLHLHYVDYDLCNARHLARVASYSAAQQKAYICKVNNDLRQTMLAMTYKPETWFADGQQLQILDWMKEEGP